MILCTQGTLSLLDRKELAAMKLEWIPISSSQWPFFPTPVLQHAFSIYALALMFMALHWKKLSVFLLRLYFFWLKELNLFCSSWGSSKVEDILDHEARRRKCESGRTETVPVRKQYGITSPLLFHVSVSMKTQQVESGAYSGIERSLKERLSKKYKIKALEWTLFSEWSISFNRAMLDSPRNNVVPELILHLWTLATF